MGFLDNDTPKTVKDLDLRKDEKIIRFDSYYPGGKGELVKVCPVYAVEVGKSGWAYYPSDSDEKWSVAYHPSGLRLFGDGFSLNHARRFARLLAHREVTWPKVNRVRKFYQDIVKAHNDSLPRKK